MTAETDWRQRLVKAGKRLEAARAEEAAARKEARELTIAAVADGQSEAGVARDLGVDRMAVREWLGKRRR
ncbi:hypothetical protein AWB91_09780 [Mycobacterium paraense]|uniref:Transposase n=1 Tax=Mycobacterium paraense TaxID=767916 RepID=A0ABX3VR57_9MYCO|nr:hypothetical protein [Mycobacterium paraense]ORW32766.1 hypothetical protein AWB91_09780 [Mycobacterium paraense]ORW44992.1 hypothetical protein AWB88_04855 [Mycobacterium paraense]